MVRLLEGQLASSFSMGIRLLSVFFHVPTDKTLIRIIKVCKMPFALKEFTQHQPLLASRITAGRIMPTGMQDNDSSIGSVCESRTHPFKVQ